MISKSEKLTYQSKSPFNAHCTFASDCLVDAAFGCMLVLVARSVTAEAAKASWNRVINFGLARSTSLNCETFKVGTLNKGDQEAIIIITIIKCGIIQFFSTC